MPTIQINQLNYYYEVQGQGPPLLLLHGFTGCTRNWDEIVPRLAAWYQVVTLDLPGHGRSDSPSDPTRYGMTAVSADICQLMATINPHEAGFHLLGYSMGGRLALYVAVHHPERVRSLVLESASPGLATAVERQARRQQDDALADRIEREGVASFVTFWEQLPLWASQQQLSPSTLARSRRLRWQNNALGLANSLRGMGTAVQPSLWDQLSALALPTLIITGELDAKFVQIGRAMATAIPQARYEEIAGAGHTVHLERPLDYVGGIGRFQQITP